MNRLNIFLFVILMLLTDVLAAQKKNELSLQWKVISELPSSDKQNASLGFAGPVAGIHQDILIIAGGANFPDSMPWLGGKKKYYNDVYVFEMHGNKLALAKDIFKLPFKIAYAGCCSTTKGVLYAGGENETGISKNVFYIQWNKKTKKVAIKKYPDLPIPLTNASASVNQNKIYVAGGETTDAVSDKLFMLDLNNLNVGWKEMPSLPFAISHFIMVSHMGKNNPGIYIIGGRKKNANGISDLYNTVLEFDISTNMWKKKKSLPYTLSAGTGMILPGCILVFGGDKGETFHQVEELAAAIKEEKEEFKKQELIKEKNLLLSLHPGFSKEILLYNITTNNWKSFGTIPFTAPVTTTAVKWGTSIIIPSGEIKAGVRTPKVLHVKVNNK